MVALFNTFLSFYCTEDVWTVRFSPDCDIIATGGFRGKVRLYGVKDGLKKVSLDTGGKFAISHAFVSH